MWKHVASNAMTLMIVVLVVLGGLISWAGNKFNADGPMEAAQFFEVQRGASLRTVSNNLAEQGIVEFPALFRMGADYTERADKLKYGNYEIPAHASMDQVLQILTEGGQSSFKYAVNFVIGNNGGELRLSEKNAGNGGSSIVEKFKGGDEATPIYAQLVADKTPMAYRVTIAEGLTSWQVLEGLKNADFLEGAAGDVPAEGSLAPDSYEVSRGSSIARMIERMTLAQETILAELWELRDGDLPLSTPQEALVLASIIEKETGVSSERELVASVFVNRLQRGMKLQTDPTVIYGITNGQGGLGRGLRQSELRRETTYNTYRIPALPPTPIANPGYAAIKAALQPGQSEFIFFVADGTGGHAFARTLGEHNANVRKWRAIEADQ